MAYSLSDNTESEVIMTDNRTSFEIVAKVLRSSNAESMHFGAVAVVDVFGKLTHYVGNPSMPFMTRSSIKPFQLLPLIRTGAADHFGFTPRQLAIMCGSHNGSDEHVAVTASNLKLAGLQTSDLQCGTHKPLFMDIEKIYPQHGEDTDPLRHNCSGKHSGFLALAKFLKEDIGTYLDPNSKTQTLIREAIAEMCEVDPDSMPRGVDGCSAPNYAMPLSSLAVGFMKLATLQGKDEITRNALTRIRNAMQQYPEMVSGDKRFDLAVMQSFPNRVVCKVGAESIQGFGFSEPAVGIAVKILDGAKRALEPVCLETMRQLGVFASIDDVPYLRRYCNPQIKNYRGIVTGSVNTQFKLHKSE